MELLNFELYGDGISLEWQGSNFDLHNNFNFEGFNYNLPLRQLKLVWRRSTGAWAKNAALLGLTLVFQNVSFLKVKERDGEYPFTEDDCLCNISHHPTEMRDEFDSVMLGKSSPGDDLTLSFQSEWGIKINSETVEFIPFTGPGQ